MVTKFTQRPLCKFAKVLLSYPLQPPLMQVVVLLHKPHIHQSQEHNHAKQVNPMCQKSVRDQVDEHQRDYQMEGHVEHGNGHVRNAQLIGYELVDVLAVSLAQGIVELDAVDDGQAAVNAIDYQEQHPGHISLGKDQLADGQQQDEGNAHPPHIARKALRANIREIS